MADDEEMMKSEDDSSSDEDESLAAAEAALRENLYSYEAHEQYVAALRKAGDLDKLRAARVAMNELFPLSGKMWQEWANDEARLLCGDGEEDAPSDLSPVVELYERGLKEYLYVPLWLDYLEFVEEKDLEVVQCTSQGLLKMRALYERAITAAGIHATEGWKIWDAYLEFEQAVLVAMADSSEDEKKQQAGRVESLFHRELAVPLSKLDTTLEEYIEWQNDQGKDIGSPEDKMAGIDPKVSSAFKKAEAAWLECKVFEDSVSSEKPADGELLQNYLLYINFEQNKSNSDPARVQLVFERAITVFPVTRELWLQYTDYLDHKLKVPSICKGVYARAVRNCPWVAELWRKYLLTLERSSSSDEEMSEVFEQSLQRGFQTPLEYMDVFLTRVDALRRKMAPVNHLREIFERASELLSTYFPDFVDLRLQGYWARLEVRLSKDVKAAREIWERVVKTHGWMTEVWQGYMSMELGLDNINEVRALYKRCYSRKLEGNGSEVVCQAWLQFEREYGTLEDFEKAFTKAGQRLQELQSLNTKDVQEHTKARIKHERTNQENASPLKRKRGKDVKEEKKKQKRDKKPDKLHDKGKNEEMDEDVKQQVNEGKEKAQGKVEAGPKIKKTYTDELTVFVSGISLEVTDKQLMEFFASCGGIKDLRLLKERGTKRSRGLAYIDFESEENLVAALAKNKAKLGSRKLCVARSKPPKERKQGDEGVATQKRAVKPLGWIATGQTSATKAEQEPALNSNEEFRKKLLTEGTKP